jgi:transposase
MGAHQELASRARRNRRRDCQGQSAFCRGGLYRYRTGIPWRDLPERFGDFRVVHLRFSRWAKTGVWARVFEHLAQDADNEYAMIDATIVRAHQHSAGAQKKTATTKRSAAAKAD